jgi:hypothetical protein
MTSSDLLHTDCYDQKSQKFTEDVAEFFGEIYQFSWCVDGNRDNDSCNHCNEQYSKLNAFYEHMDGEYYGNLCLDIRAEMGKAREKWSSLGCVIPIGYDILVLSVASAVIVITFLVYLISRRVSNVNPPGIATQKRLSSQLNIQSIADESTSLLEEGEEVLASRVDVLKQKKRQEYEQV